jgi:hypothetical protein
LDELEYLGENLGWGAECGHDGMSVDVVAGLWHGSFEVHRVYISIYRPWLVLEIVVSDNRHRVFITEEYPTRGVCFSFTCFDIRTFTCFICVSLVLGSVYILDRASIGMHGFCFDPRASALSIPAHVAAPYFNTRR